MCTNEFCNTAIATHTRNFVHAEFRIEIKMNVVADELPITTLAQLNASTNQISTSTNSTQSNLNETSILDSNKQLIKYDDINIYMWSTCKKCQKVGLLLIYFILFKRSISIALFLLF